MHGEGKDQGPKWGGLGEGKFPKWGELGEDKDQGFPKWGELGEGKDQGFPRCRLSVTFTLNNGYDFPTHVSHVIRTAQTLYYYYTYSVQ